MNECISKYQKRSDDFAIIDNSKKRQFLDELSDGEIYIEILQKKSKLRTYLQNNYLWGGIYSEFIPNHFHGVSDAHEYFTLKHLKRTGMYDENDTEIMQYELSKARKILNVIIKEGIMIVDYILSTTALSTKEFKSYTDIIKVEGSEQGIIFKEPEEYHKF